jgi:hypothetical protein
MKSINERMIGEETCLMWKKLQNGSKILKN